MAESVMISLGVTSKNLDAELQKTKGKFQKLNQSVMSDGATKNITAMKNSLSGLGKMGDSLGGMFGKIAGGFSSLLSPIGLITAGIGLAITASVNLYKKLTLSHEQYIAYLDNKMKSSQSKLNKVQNNEKTDSGYFERLKQLNQVEQMSNATKTQAITLIQLLTAKYGDLGLSIDETTGKIIGLDNAFAMFQKRISKAKLNEMQLIADIAKRKTEQQGKIVSSKMGRQQKNGVMYDYYNDKPLIDFLTAEQLKKFRFGSNKESKQAMESARKRKDEWFQKTQMESISDESRNEYTNIEKRLSVLKNKNVLNNQDREQLQALSAKKEKLKQIMKLQFQLYIAEERIRETAADPEINKQWVEYSEMIRDAINKQRQANIELEKQQQGQIGRLNKAKQIANEQLQIRLKIKQAEKQAKSNKQQTEKMQQEHRLSLLTKTERAQEFQKKQWQAKRYASGSQSEDSTNLNDESLDLIYGRKIDTLEDKQKQGTITKQEQKWLEIYKALYGARIKAYRETEKEYKRLMEKENLTPEQTIQLEQIATRRSVQGTNYSDLLTQQKAFQKKQEKQGLSAGDFNRLLEINKQIAIIEQAIAQSKELQSKYDKQAVEWSLKRAQITDELNKYFRDLNFQLDDELQYQELMLKNDVKQIEKRKIINQLAAQGHHMGKLMKDPEFAKKVDDYAERKMKLDQQKYFNGQNKGLDREVELMRLQIQGKAQEIEKLKIINDLKEKGIRIDEKQVEKLLQKKKTLNALQLQSNLLSQAFDLQYGAQSLQNKKQAEIDKRIREYERKYGKLNDDQKDKVQRIVNYQFELQKLQNNKPDLSRYEIKTNSLTQRGGFSSGVVMSRMETINEKIATSNAKQVDLLSKIKILVNELTKTDTI